MLADPAPQPSYAPEIAETTILSDANTPPVNTVKGRYLATEDMRAADAPLDVKLGGIGRVKGMGRARLGGSIQFGGFRMADHPDVLGTVTLTNARGSVTVKLLGYGGYSEIPNGRFVTTASVVKGTGAFTNFRRIGTATVTFGPNTVQSIQAPSPVGGKMTLTLDLKPPVR